MALWTWPGGRSKTESKAAVPLFALTHLGEATWGGSDGAALARDGFKRNAVAYRCVRMIAEAAASVPLVSGQARAARLLRQPMPDCDGTSFLETVFAQLQIHGNAYVEAVRLDGEADLAGLFPLSPDTVSLSADARGWTEAYVIRERRGNRTVRRDESGWSPMLHLKLFNPSDPLRGQPPLAAARRALDLHNASADWAKSLIDNSAKPSGALVYGGGGRLPDDQFERLKAEMERLYSGAGNAGRPLLLEGGLEWRQMSLSPAEMDFQEARNAAAREIALALGVPPMLLGIPGDNTYANYAQANLAFWRMTILPLVEKLARALSIWLDAPMGEAVDIRPDLDRVSALAAERDALWARLDAASFATLEEKRVLAGLDR